MEFSPRRGGRGRSVRRHKDDARRKGPEQRILIPPSSFSFSSKPCSCSDLSFFLAMSSPRAPSDVPGRPSCKRCAGRVLPAFVCWMMRPACRSVGPESGAWQRKKENERTQTGEGKKSACAEFSVGRGRAQKARPPVETFGHSSFLSCPSFLSPQVFSLLHPTLLSPGTAARNHPCSLLGRPSNTLCCFV